ncbi:MAG: LLM class flavin-dependent oxidoreductase [Candidatus Thorarchaeota archaeon]
MKTSIFVPLFADSSDALHPGFAPKYDSLNWDKTQKYVVEAEALGFEAAWVPDHLIMGRNDQILDPFTALASFATITKTIGLGTVVICSAFRHPAVLAKMLASIDFVSNGRMIAGLGSGFHAREFNAFGFPPVDRERTQEVAKILRLLFDRSTGPVDFFGDFYTLTRAVSRPRPLGRMPIYIAGNSPKSLQIAAKSGQGWITGGTLRESRDRLRFLRSLLDTQENQNRLADIVWFGPVSIQPDGHSSMTKTRRGIQGNSSQVIQQIEAYRELGFTHIIAAFTDFPETKMAKLFMEEVSPSI